MRTVEDQTFEATICDSTMRYTHVQVVHASVAAELQTALAATLEGEAWLPIESAPKDGTDILLYAPSCFWLDAPSVGQTTSTIPERITCGGWQDGYGDLEGGWCSWDGGFTEKHPPTHWRPMPSGPSTIALCTEGKP